MTAPNFNPGFRILPFDVLGLIIGLLGALATLPGLNGLDW